MLRKRVKDLETEYKQLQLEYQVKESRVVDLESDVEVSFYSILRMNLWLLSVLWVWSGPVLGCLQFGHELVFFAVWVVSDFMCVFVVLLLIYLKADSSGNILVMIYYGLRSYMLHFLITSVCSIVVFVRHRVCGIWFSLHEACSNRSQVFHKTLHYL